jgi:hypothetical protein
MLQVSPTQPFVPQTMDASSIQQAWLSGGSQGVLMLAIASLTGAVAQQLQLEHMPGAEFSAAAHGAHRARESWLPAGWLVCWTDGMYRRGPQV